MGDNNGHRLPNATVALKHSFSEVHVQGRPILKRLRVVDMVENLRDVTYDCPVSIPSAHLRTSKLTTMRQCFCIDGPGRFIDFEYRLLTEYSIPMSKVMSLMYHLWSITGREGLDAGDH